jgi:hypothetical protein
MMIEFAGQRTTAAELASKLNPPPTAAEFRSLLAEGVALEELGSRESTGHAGYQEYTRKVADWLVRAKAALEMAKGDACAELTCFNHAESGCETCDGQLCEACCLRRKSGQ